jgi:hypothetical protein
MKEMWWIEREREREREGRKERGERGERRVPVSGRRDSDFAGRAVTQH